MQVLTDSQLDAAARHAAKDLQSLKSIFSAPLVDALIAAIETGAITALSHPDAIIAALAAAGVVVPPVFVPMISALCAMLLQIIPKPA